MTANDCPYKVGDYVSVIRHRHGWHDGNIQGEVTMAYKNDYGTWKYVVKITNDECGEYEVDVEHTRDLRKVWS